VGLAAEEVLSSLVGMAGFSLTTLFVTASTEISELALLGTDSRTVSGLIVSLILAEEVLLRVVGLVGRSLAT